MSKRVLCVFVVTAFTALALAADHGDKPVTASFVRLLNRLFHDRIEMTWALERDESGRVSGIVPCISPTPGLTFELGVFEQAPSDDGAPDAIVTILPPNPILPPSPIKVQVNNPGAFVFFDRSGNPLVLVGR